MTMQTAVIDHPARRLVVALPHSYDAARETYEALVPEVDLARFRQAPSWQATLELVETNAPHGFMRYYRSDITSVMAGSESTWKATQYLMGNHAIAERMYRHDPSVMLHAPLRTLLYGDTFGEVKLAVDQPSLLFTSYGDPRIAAVGHELDALLAQLITLLDGRVPPQSSPAHTRPWSSDLSTAFTLGPGHRGGRCCCGPVCEDSAVLWFALYLAAPLCRRAPTARSRCGSTTRPDAGPSTGSRSSSTVGTPASTWRTSARRASSSARRAS